MEQSKLRNIFSKKTSSDNWQIYKRQRNTPYLSVFNPNTGKYGPE